MTIDNGSARARTNNDGARAPGSRGRSLPAGLLGTVSLSGLLRTPEGLFLTTAGALIVDRVMHFAAASEPVVSDRGVRWGLAEELLSARD